VSIYDHFQFDIPKKKKKVDREALNSQLSRIPGVDLKTVRDLIDIGFTTIEDLYGRAPETLFEEICRKKENVPQDRLWMLRLAVYYAETPEPEQEKLTPWAWQD